MNPILEKNLYEDKFGTLDIKANIDNALCNVEMQVVNEGNFEKN